MLVFDASSRAECQMRRQQSSSPLQALVLLNDEQMIEACRVIAENMWRMNPENIPKAASEAFRLLTSREPTQKEAEILLRQYQEELAYFREKEEKASAYLEIGYKAPDPALPATEIAALARVTNTILNSTEAYYKN